MPVNKTGTSTLASRRSTRSTLHSASTSSLLKMRRRPSRTAIVPSEHARPFGDHAGPSATRVTDEAAHVVEFRASPHDDEADSLDPAEPSAAPMAQGRRRAGTSHFGNVARRVAREHRSG